MDGTGTGIASLIKGEVLRMGERSVMKAKLFLAALALLVAGTSLAAPDPEPWRRLAEAGKSAYERGYYPEAEKALKAALAEVERVGDQEPLAVCLNNLGVLYHATGRNDEAAAMIRRSLELRRRINGAEHPLVATGLNNLAEVYRGERQYE